MSATRDRFNEPLDDEQLAPGEHDPACIDGWLPDTWDGRANPCLTCRPHLAGRALRLRRQLEGPRP